MTKTLGNNVSLNIEYNNRYQIKKHEWKKSGVTITGYNYGHDSVGNRIWSENIVTPNKSELFAFDNADRLTSFKTGTLNATKNNIVTPTYLQGWTLDSIGNWSQFNDNGVNSVNTFTDTHEMTQFKGITNTFDNNGNLTSDGVRTFKYDAFNRIIEVKIGSVILAQYQYDAFNRRVMKKVDAELNGSFETTVKFLYDGFRCIEELNASDALTKEYVYGSLYIDEVILQRTGATDYYFTHDYRYSVTSLTNASGSIVESYDYRVYGERTCSGSGLTDVGYTGQRHDSETGMMYFKNRYYSVLMGQFVTRDPLGYVDGMSMYLGYFGAKGRDPMGNYLEDAHFYTTFEVAVSAGYAASEAFELAYYSQLPDEVADFEAIEVVKEEGKLAIAQALSKNPEVSKALADKRNAATKWRKDVQKILHSLSGTDAKERQECLKKMLMDKKLNPKLEIWEKGFIIHALGDAFSHSRHVKNKNRRLYSSPFGHYWDDQDPDTIALNIPQYNDFTNNLYEGLGGQNNNNPQQSGINGLQSFVESNIELVGYYRVGRAAYRFDSEATNDYSLHAFDNRYRHSAAWKSLKKEYRDYDPRGDGFKVLPEKVLRTPTHSEVQNLINKIKAYCNCKD